MERQKSDSIGTSEEMRSSIFLGIFYCTTVTEFKSTTVFRMNLMVVEVFKDRQLIKDADARVCKEGVL